MAVQTCFCEACPKCRHRVVNRAYKRRKAAEDGVSHRRLPIEPLIAKVGLERLVSVTNSQLYRVIRRGTGILDDTADRWALACGYHPGEVWDEWWDLDD